MDKLINNPTVQRIKEKFNEDPLATTVVAAVAVSSAAKLIDALSAARGRRAYAKDVDRRVRQSRKYR